MANQHEAIKARLLATFAVQAQEHLQALTANLLALDRGLPPAETREVVEVIFREMHTLKGAARSVSLVEVESLCQGMESILSRMARGDLALSRPILGRLQEGVDGVARLLAGNATPVAVRELIGRLEQVASEPASAAAEPVAAPAPPAAALAEPVAAGVPPADTIRLATATLDALLLQAEDLLVPKLAAAERSQEARVLSEALTRCHTAMQRLRTHPSLARSNGQTADLLADLDAQLRQTALQARALLGHLGRDERTLTGAVDGLLAEMRRMRMMPASAVLDLFPPMVRDLAREQGKEVEWVARGADLEVDRKVLEAIKDPLIHLVRNAIDHGIELPETRAQAGKAPQGQVTVTVAPVEGGRIEICVEDDGGGIDLAQVRAEAVRSRLLTAEAAAALTDEAALSLIYRSGLSTSPLITHVSGHGLGLAIVQERVEGLGGTILLETRAGAGTTMRLLLPATITTFRGLLVQVGGQPFLLPIEAVEWILRVAPSAIEPIAGREVVRYNGHSLAVAHLDALLGLPQRADGSAPESKQWCVILRSGEERAACIVTEVLGGREGLVKELQPPLVRIRHVAGAGLLGTGQVILILRPADLLRAIRESPQDKERGVEVGANAYIVKASFDQSNLLEIIRRLV